MVAIVTITPTIVVLGLWRVILWPLLKVGARLRVIIVCLRHRIIIVHPLPWVATPTMVTVVMPPTVSTPAPAMIVGNRSGRKQDGNG
jgi:hypothetical protein